MEVEKYSGDTLLNYQEQFAQAKGEVDSWVEVAERVFSRHTQEDASKFPEHVKMTAVLEVEKLFRARAVTVCVFC